MLDVFKQYAINLEAEVEGVWRTLHGAEFLIARAGNREFNKALAESYRKHQKALEADDEKADQLAAQIINEAIAEHIVKDWKNVGLKGKELPYSKDNVVKLLSMPELRDFREALLSLSEDVEAYRLQEEEAQTKNS